ncbi:P pilus assembly chaperone PapD [Chryseobacterium sp. SLBN-27]|jgi:P pilus assembly chaperone PapD|uniref:fimbrial biogenesis chaperone n=1 Tax=Chryseobacterium sp. SLBN-27 TaxID=3042287 RepID=UPI00258D595E|nr:molecular chaperone [Chryseobacterium sp. SLBN-27]MDR6157755.1 P pilus assembly chaperone PapD [Chryseobacterium sp. SLBN-27]
MMNKTLKIHRILVFIFVLLFSLDYAQTGVSVSPPRLYFESTAGNSNTQKITITNVSTKNTLDLAVSLGDWEYNEKGENIMYAANTLKNSCAGWISVKKEDNYFSLAPGERKDIDVTITVPNKPTDTLAAHTAVLYVSQMNPVDDVDNKGAKIKVSIRSGIKVFHKVPSAKAKKIEIQNLTYDKPKKQLDLFFENQGNIWTDGKVYTDLVNIEDGKKVSIDPIIFYTMPGNKREMDISLPADLPKGKYTASVMIDYGDNNLELGELNFIYD